MCVQVGDGFVPEEAQRKNPIPIQLEIADVIAAPALQPCMNMTRAACTSAMAVSGFSAGVQCMCLILPCLLLTMLNMVLTVS